MKHLVTATLLAASVTTAFAQPFDFQRQTGSSEYVAGADTTGMHFPAVAKQDFIPSLTRLMLGANVDGIAPNRITGRIVPRGPTRISLYEVQRDSPEGIAYRGYHERYPVGTDWERLAREFRERQVADHLASKRQAGSDES